MQNNFETKFKHFTEEWSRFIFVPYNFLNVAISLFFLNMAYKIVQYAGTMATKNASVELTDFFLSNIPRIDTSFIHGTLSFFLFDMRLLLFLIFIKYTPFTAKALAMIVLLRAAVINLTNVGMPPDIIPINSDFTFGGDLFFSGHVANLFMLSLCFWNIKILRYFFMTLSIIFGVSAILGHYHYTIDVVSAPFFAYGVFVICKKLFKGDYERTLKTVDKLS